MSRLWKTVCKGFRHYVGSFVNVETTNAPGFGCPISSLSDHELIYSLHNSCQVASITATSSTKEDQGKYSGFNNHEGLDFKWNRSLTKSIFLEICGLSSAIALGWQFGHPHGKRQCSCNDSPNLVKVLANIALTSAFNGVRFNINKVPSVNATSHSTTACSTTTSQVCDKYVNTKTALQLTLTEEINATFIGMLEKLETSNCLELADWQNAIGVELISSAKKNKVSEYDHLITSPKADRTLAYRNEAFLCFIESKKLGSAKGAYNLGLCYEQGIGTSVDLEKAAVCYEEAAEKNHSAAQYNLGLLYYRRYVSGEKSKDRDLSKAFSLLHKAAQQGLVEARSAISVLKNDVSTRFPKSTMEQNKEDISSLLMCGSSFRKAVSEPHDFSYYSVDSNERSTIPRFGRKIEGPVTFYVGD